MQWDPKSYSQAVVAFRVIMMLKGGCFMSSREGVAHLSPCLSLTLTNLGSVFQTHLKQPVEEKWCVSATWGISNCSDAVKGMSRLVCLRVPRVVSPPHSQMYQSIRVKRERICINTHPLSHWVKNCWIEKCPPWWKWLEERRANVACTTLIEPFYKHCFLSLGCMFLWLTVPLEKCANLPSHS